jgi:phosphoglycerate dehydrogenase-like enzyme
MKTTMPKVILTEHLDDEPAGWLAERTRLVRCAHDDEPAMARELPDAEGLVIRTYTQVNDALLDYAPKLRVVGRAGVGLDNVDLDACRQRNVRVVYTPDANTQAVVEYVWALVLDAVRPRLYMDHYVAPPRFHEYRKRHIGRQLDLLVLGILGMGRIGRRVAEVAHAIGMRVIYNDLLTRRELGLSDEEKSEFVDKDTLYREADILTIHVDGRASNRHLLNASVLDQLKSNGVLINAARGMLVDNAALVEWAKGVETTGGRAYLDVHEPEPPTDDYALFDVPNVHLLPHLASRTPQAMANMSWVVRDVVRVLQGESPKWPAV